MTNGQFYNHFQVPAIFCQLYEHLSQNLGSTCHFEDPNISKTQLNQKLQYEIQNFPIQFFFQFCKKKT